MQQRSEVGGMVERRSNGKGMEWRELSLGRNMIQGREYIGIECRRIKENRSSLLLSVLYLVSRWKLLTGNRLTCHIDSETTEWR